ncbi:hypothetical protein C0992_004257 [Termitomyces sp. T32_za158]|nr:hypothetical protein C0992_004257 [Termitomyces sp. T32_za158]
MATYTQSCYQTDTYGYLVPNPNYLGDERAGPLYGSSISQRAPINWQQGALHNSHYSQVLPGGLPKTPPQNWHPLPIASAGPFAPGAYYTDPAPAPPAWHDPFRHSRPPAPPLARIPPSPLARRQQVAEYVQQRNSALQGLRMNPKEFARRTQTLLASLGQRHLDGTPEDWAHRLLDLNDQGVTGQLSEAIRKDLQQNTFKRNKLRYLVDKIHTLPNPGTITVRSR